MNTGRVALLLVGLFLIIGCGGGGGGGGALTSSNSEPTPTPIRGCTDSTADNYNPSANVDEGCLYIGAMDDLLGNFRFVYSIYSTFTHRYTLNKRLAIKNDEGYRIYEGFDADYPSLDLYALATWYESRKQYFLIDEPVAVNGDELGMAYLFSINGDGSLSGLANLAVNGSFPYSPNRLSGSSRRYNSGYWSRSLLRQDGDLPTQEERLRRIRAYFESGSSVNSLMSSDSAEWNAACRSVMRNEIASARAVGAQ
jgi:hypothetical protein